MTASDLQQIKQAIREVLAEQQNRKSISDDMAYIASLPIEEQKKILKQRREQCLTQITS